MTKANHARCDFDGVHQRHLCSCVIEEQKRTPNNGLKSDEWFAAAAQAERFDIRWAFTYEHRV